MWWHLNTAAGHIDNRDNRFGLIGYACLRLLELCPAIGLLWLLLIGRLLSGWGDGSLSRLLWLTLSGIFKGLCSS